MLCYEFCNLQHLAGLKICEVILLQLTKLFCFTVVTNLHVTFIVKTTFLVGYFIVQQNLIEFRSVSSCFTALFCEIQHAKKHLQPLYQNICCPPKGLLIFIIVSSGLLSLFILFCSFCSSHFHCFPTEQPPGASVEHKHSKVTAGLMGQWNPSPYTVGSVFPYGTFVEVSVRIKFWKRVRLLCEVTVI